jgi:hypothetical protein
LLVLAPGRPRGSRVRARLIAEAERRAMIVAALKAGDRLRSVDLIVEATQADSALVCADAPFQAVVAAVAAARDIAVAFMPSGPEDLLARDLGSPLDDPAAALSLPFSSSERTIDIAEVNGVPFVNYAAVGVELAAPPVRSRRVQLTKAAARARAPARARRGSAASGEPGHGPEALLVCNNRFELLDDGLGSRDWPESGRLQVLTFPNAGADRAFTTLRRDGWEERSSTSLELCGRAAVSVDVDGRQHVLHPPLRFRSVGSAVRVRAPGASGAPGEAGASGAEAKDTRLEPTIQTG